MVKESFNGVEPRRKIKKGINKAVNAVKPTLGAVGNMAIIDLGGDFFPLEADDGITVLRNLKYKDRFEQTGLSMVKKRVMMVSEEGGDATATTSTLIQAVTNEAFAEWGGRPENTANIIKRLDSGLKDVIELLNAMSKPVAEQDIERVATVASLDPEIGKIIAEAYSKVGKEGIITVESSSQIGYSSEVVKGARFNQGFISPYFITNPEKLESVLENPAVLVINRRVAANSQLKIIEKLVNQGINNILIIADNVEGEALASLVMNHQKGLIRVCAVKPQYEADKKNEWMQDIAILTGAKVISEETGIILENVDERYVGRAEKVVVTRKHTTIINGQGNEEKINERVDVIRNLLTEEKSDAMKKYYEERIGSLIGGIGVIRVGAFTDTELQNMKYKINNAINVVKGGLEEGVVIGGGSALAKIARIAKEKIFRKAITAPLRTMAENAGIYDKKKWYQKWCKPTTNSVVELVQLLELNEGINFITKRAEDLMESGVIDSVKNTRLALEAAVSVAKSLIKGETVITEEDNENQG